MSEFQGFSQASVDFLWGIRFNNERTWFLAHKQEYLELVDGPIRALGAEVHREMEEKYPQLGLNLRISRIYRDARRLHGRGPYKDHLWFTLGPPKEPGVSRPALYFEIAPEYFSYGMGYYSASPEVMAALRARIDRDPKTLEKLARKLKGSEFTLEGREYKRLKGDPGPLLAPWYNRREIALTHDENCEGILFQPQLVQRVVQGFDFLIPYYSYLLS